MEPIHYEIDTAHITGLSLTPLENVKIEAAEPYWEAKANLAILTLTFPKTRVHEIRFGIMSSINLLVEGGRNRDMTEKVLLLERTEYAAAKGCKMSRYEVDKEMPMKCVVVTIENVEHDKVLKLAYLGLFRREEEPEPPLRKHRELRLHQHTRVPRSPAIRPLTKQEPVLEREFERESAPRELALLSDCIVSCLGPSEHVRRLCGALGAYYMDHLDECTTHVVLPVNLKYDEEALRNTEAKLVSVAWLEKCLDERVRQSEEDFELL